MTPRARTLALVRTLRALKVTRPRRRVPRLPQPDAQRLDYYRGIQALALAPAAALVSRYVLPVIREEAPGKSDRLDAGGKRAADAAARASREFYERSFSQPQVEDLARLAERRTDAFHKQQFDRQVRAGLGTDLFHAEPKLGPLAENWVAENVSLITSIPGTYFSEVERAVTRGVAAGTRWEDIADELHDRLGVAESRARLIARDQVGKLYGQLQEARQTALGVDGFIWRTAGDNRVREEHAVLEGQRFPWDEPPAEGIPGEPINCRCFAEPDFTSILGG